MTTGSGGDKESDGGRWEGRRAMVKERWKGRNGERETEGERWGKDGGEMEGQIWIGS